MRIGIVVKAAGAHQNVKCIVRIGGILGVPLNERDILKRFGFGLRNHLVGQIQTIELDFGITETEFVQQNACAASDVEYPLKGLIDFADAIDHCIVAPSREAIIECAVFVVIRGDFVEFSL